MDVRESPVDLYLADRMQADHALARLMRAAAPGGGAQHTPREVAQQPLLWQHTVRIVQAHAEDLRHFMRAAGCYGGEGPEPTVVFAGAGTSDYVGLSVVDLLRRRLAVRVVNRPTTRITPCPEVALSPGERYLLVHVARSGNSPESTAVLDIGLQRPAGEVRHLVITCNPEGELARRAQAHSDKAYTLVMPEASNDRGLAMTSSFSCMLVAAQALAYLDDLDGFAERVDRAAAAAEHLVATHADLLWDVAGHALDRVFYLGNNDLLGAATESALKIQELTGGEIIAKAEDTMAFRHGPISAVDEHSLIVFFLSVCPHARPYELDVIRQYQDAFAEMGARVLVVSDRPLPDDVHDAVEAVVCDPEGDWPVPMLEQANLAVLVGQLLGVFAAYRRGHHVDDPARGSALYNRTVQGVRIYPSATNGEPSARGDGAA